MANYVASAKPVEGRKNVWRSAVYKLNAIHPILIMLSSKEFTSEKGAVKYGNLYVANMALTQHHLDQFDEIMDLHYELILSGEDELPPDD